MSVTELIDYANSLLPGTPASEGENDPRWQAIMELAEYVESNPEEVWAFACKWGGHPQEDIRNAIACCVLEHLLEHHFQSIFPRVEEMVKDAFKGDIERAVDFVHWTWKRELSREKKANGADRNFRIGWRLQFSANLLTDWRLAEKRAGGSW